MKKGSYNINSIKKRFAFALARWRGITIETDLSPYYKRLEQIAGFDFHEATEGTLSTEAGLLGKRLASGESPDALLPETFALIKEVIRRVLNLEPYDVQMLAGIVLHEGKLAQMRTGEGKTLAAVFPAVLNALTGKPVHILTANDYLAGRDAAWMGKVYSFFGLSVGFVKENMSCPERRNAYNADITYLTAKQGGFDFLADGLAFDPRSRVQREFHMVIVDEADFIMIDEARIPLVIARHDPVDHADPYTVDAAVAGLSAGIDFLVDKNLRNCCLTRRGEKRIQDIFGCGGSHEERFYDLYAAVHVAIHAHVLLRKDVDYIVKNGKIELVDEFTGRIADKRRWPYGIQTALEAKERLSLQQEGRICGSITVQNFIRQYPKIAAMTATAVPAAKEFVSFYDLPVVVIPPNRPERMIHEPDRIFATKKEKLHAVVEEIRNVHASGRPILVGTKSVRESEELADLLRKSGVLCSVLNAKEDAHEAEIVSKAGMLHAVTISTNMAGRGTDIRLGGEEGRDRDRIVELGGLYVIGTNRHESARIDQQLRGRAGRQGDPGSSRFFLSLEDDLFARYGIREFIPARYADGKFCGVIGDLRVSGEIARAQQIIEDQHLVMKKTLQKYSALVEKQRAYLRLLRTEALEKHVLPSELSDICAAELNMPPQHVSESVRKKILTRVFLCCLDSFWADHLAFVDDVKEGIHLRRYSGREPILEFIREVSDAFEFGLQNAYARTAEWFGRLEITETGIDFEKEKLTGPASTWTYLLSDDPLPGFSLSFLANSNIGFAALAAIPELFLAPVAALVSAAKKGFKAKGT